MTPEQFAAFVAERVEIRNAPFRVELRAMVLSHRPMGVAYEVGAATLFVQTEVKHRESGEPLAITFEYTVSGVELAHWDESRAAEFIREQLHRIATHEMDEALHVDGERVFDPHAIRRINVSIGLLEGP